MVTVPEETQEFRSSLFDLIVEGRSPAFVGRYGVSNIMQRTLAHLVGTDGRYARLVRVTPDGVLRTKMEGATAGQYADVSSYNNLYVSIRSTSNLAAVAGANSVTAGNYGLVVSSWYGKQLFDGLVTGQCPSRIVDYGGTNQAAVNATHELAAEISSGGNKPVVATPTETFGVDVYHLAVSGYEIQEVHAILVDCWDEAAHALRTKEAS